MRRLRSSSVISAAVWRTSRTGPGTLPGPGAHRPDGQASARARRPVRPARTAVATARAALIPHTAR